MDRKFGLDVAAAESRQQVCNRVETKEIDDTVPVEV